MAENEQQRSAQIGAEASDRTEHVGAEASPTGSAEVATLAGGCFWCLEPVFDDLEGVSDVVSGYSGGHVPDPTYEAVCSGETGHAEAVQVTFDPRRISFRDLLEIFFSIHDPTTLNRQGADVGTQYRSAVFFHSPEQETVARQVIADLQDRGLWNKPIVTEVTPFTAFYPAEEYHQRYFEKHPFQPYCLLLIRPKVAKFRKQHLDRLKKRSA
jgi:peptide-methionine (S)-S-oxide reductase